jgi:hypothetical protein
VIDDRFVGARLALLATRSAGTPTLNLRLVRLGIGAGIDRRTRPAASATSALHRKQASHRGVPSEASQREYCAGVGPPVEQQSYVGPRDGGQGPATSYVDGVERLLFAVQLPATHDTIVGTAMVATNVRTGIHAGRSAARTGPVARRPPVPP